MVQLDMVKQLHKILIMKVIQQYLYSRKLIFCGCMENGKIYKFYFYHLFISQQVTIILSTQLYSVLWRMRNVMVTMQVCIITFDQLLFAKAREIVSAAPEGSEVGIENRSETWRFPFTHVFFWSNWSYFVEKWHKTGALINLCH